MSALENLRNQSPDEPSTGRACPKCGQHNSEEARFCKRCHATLQFICPSCGHRQPQGGACERCGLDFAKYALALQFQMEAESKRESERVKGRNALLKQALLLPLTGGWSLLKYIRTELRGE